MDILSVEHPTKVYGTGTDDAAFRRMIVFECMSYALRGFVIGLALSAAVAVLLGRAMLNAISSSYRASIFRERLDILGKR